MIKKPILYDFNNVLCERINSPSCISVEEIESYRKKASEIHNILFFLAPLCCREAHRREALCFFSFQIIYCVFQKPFSCRIQFLQPRYTTGY